MTRRLPREAKPLAAPSCGLQDSGLEPAQPQASLPMVWPELMTAAEVADLFGCTVRTIGNWVAAGYLAPIRIGRSRRFPSDQVDALRVRGTSVVCHVKI